MVTPTQYLPWILEALNLCRERLAIPVLYNTGGYERVEMLRLLEGRVQIYLPDLKYYDSALSARNRVLGYNDVMRAFGRMRGVSYSFDALDAQALYARALRFWGYPRLLCKLSTEFSTVSRVLWINCGLLWIT